MTFVSEKRIRGSAAPDAARENLQGTFILSLYRLLEEHYGDLQWWPGETPFEIAVGAILTQNTNWRNVEKAIGNLKKQRLLSPAAIAGAPDGLLEEALRPSGFFRVKARRLRAFTAYLIRCREGAMESLLAENTGELRREFLQIHGIGEETADSILLYGLGKPVFVVDAYTRRVLERHGVPEARESYGSVQRLFMEALPEGPAVYNRCHALLVQVGKDFCRKDPRCGECPLLSMEGRPVGRGMSW